MPAMAQVNIRVDVQIKRAGDATLERANVTPTQLVRAVWAKLATGAEGLDQLLETLALSPSSCDAASGDGQPAGDALVERIQARQAAFQEAMGLDPQTFVPSTSEQLDDLLHDEWVERERERMVWNAQ